MARQFVKTVYENVPPPAHTPRGNVIHRPSNHIAALEAKVNDWIAASNVIVKSATYTREGNTVFMTLVCEEHPE